MYNVKKMLDIISRNKKNLKQMTVPREKDLDFDFKVQNYLSVILTPVLFVLGFFLSIA